MKYRDLEINFTIENASFKTISIALEKLTKPMPMHSHSKNSYEIHYISYGYGQLRTENKTYSITPGTLFVTGPEIAHEQFSDYENPMTEYCLYIKVDNAKHAPGSLASTFLNQSFWFGCADNSFYDLMKQIISELETRNVGYELVLRALLQQIIMYLTRKYLCDSNIDVSTIPSSSNDLTYLIIEEAFLYDYKDVTLDSLSRQLGLGNRQTERLIKLHYGKTFQQKKTEARMSAACSLLKDNNQSVSDIAFALGYSSVEHFSGAFKKNIGCTPTKYRHF